MSIIHKIKSDEDSIIKSLIEIPDEQKEREFYLLEGFLIRAITNRKASPAELPRLEHFFHSPPCTSEYESYFKNRVIYQVQRRLRELNPSSLGPYQMGPVSVERGPFFDGIISGDLKPGTPLRSLEEYDLNHIYIQKFYELGRINFAFFSLRNPHQTEEEEKCYRRHLLIDKGIVPAKTRHLWHEFTSRERRYLEIILSDLFETYSLDLAEFKRLDKEHKIISLNPKFLACGLSLTQLFQLSPEIAREILDNADAVGILLKTVKFPVLLQKYWPRRGADITERERCHKLRRQLYLLAPLINELSQKRLSFESIEPHLEILYLNRQRCGVLSLLDLQIPFNFMMTQEETIRDELFYYGKSLASFLQDIDELEKILKSPPLKRQQIYIHKGKIKQLISAGIPLEELLNLCPEKFAALFEGNQYLRLLEKRTQNEAA